MTNTPTALQTTQASNVIKTFVRTHHEAANVFTDGLTTDRDQGFHLDFDNPFHSVRVSFFRSNRPDLMRIQCSNYRAEDEANGYYTTEQAREFYRGLLVAGFRAF